MKPVSKAEKKYIEEGCALGIRIDGRDLEALRTISIENNIFPHVNGSSRLRVDGAVDIICSIKLEISEIQPSNCESDDLVVSMDISPSCNIYSDERILQTYSTQVGERLQSMLIGSSALNLEQFVILPNKYRWAVHVDLLVMQLDGDPLDMCSLAAIVALSCTRIPATQAIPGESGLLEDFEVQGDVSTGSAVQAGAVPLFVTIAKVGNALLLDASGDEQQCASCVVAVAVDSQGACCGIEYLKHGLLDASELTACIKKATAAAAGIFENVRKFNDRMAAAEASGVSTNDIHPDVPLARLGLLF